MAERLLYSTAEACARLNIGKTKLFDLLATGELASTQIGKARLIAADDLDDFVSRLRSNSAAPERVRALLEVVDDNGKVDIARIPSGTTLADLEAAKQTLSQPQAVA
ncbi:MAG TPA: helix-turn-helix domain-containing protein [Nocardioides sp.]